MSCLNFYCQNPMGGGGGGLDYLPEGLPLHDKYFRSSFYPKQQLDYTNCFKNRVHTILYEICLVLIEFQPKPNLDSHRRAKEARELSIDAPFLISVISGCFDISRTQGKQL